MAGRYTMARTGCQEVDFGALVNVGFEVIVVDPPWPVRKIRQRLRPNQTTMDYATMSVDQITKLPIRSLATAATATSWLFLWVPQKFLFDAKGILEGWGFNYLVTSVWQKTYGVSAGMPLYGFRWNAEFILIGYRRKPELWPSRPLIPLVFQAENVRHSQKPDLFYETVVALGKPRIDVFARKARKGWYVWGNEVVSV